MLKQTPKQKRNGFGIDGISINRFAQTRDESISHIARKVRNNEYKASPLKPHFIPKPNKKERVICVPTVSDRLLQRSVLQHLNEKGYTLDNDISYGFIKGKHNSVKCAGARATSLRNRYRWAYKADISEFFDKIARDELKNMVAKKVRAKSLHNLIYSFIDTEIHTENIKTRKKIESKGILKGVGLRQGMPISPYLANLFLSDFDQIVIKKKIPMVRYADDLIAFGKTESECNEIHSFCVDYLSNLGLTIHEIKKGGKTEIVGPMETVEFLGLGLELGSNDNYQLVVTKPQLFSIKQSMLELSKLDYCQKNNITISTLLRKLDYKISGYNAAYEICANSEQLFDSIRDFRSLVIKRLLTNNFGINIDKLSKKQKIFLELEGF